MIQLSRLGIQLPIFWNRTGVIPKANVSTTRPDPLQLLRPESNVSYFDLPTSWLPLPTGCRKDRAYRRAEREPSKFVLVGCRRTAKRSDRRLFVANLNQLGFANRSRNSWPDSPGNHVWPNRLRRFPLMPQRREEYDDDSKWLPKPLVMRPLVNHGGNRTGSRPDPLR
jgi:hypothetical protein